MHPVFKVSKADVLRHADLCKDLSSISEDIMESAYSFYFSVRITKLFDLVKLLRQRSISYEVNLRPGTHTFF
jgi:hypothetical protein